jgi:hypothetical protein
MPYKCPIDPLLPALLSSQDLVIHRDQALAHGLTPRAVKYRLQTRQWQVLLPQVYLSHPGEPSRRQMLVAALLYAGPAAAIDAADACRYHGARAVAVDETRVYVVVPDNSPVRSRGFVVVRRTAAPIRIVASDLLRYVGPAPAAIAAARQARSSRSVLAILSDALQRNVTTYDELVDAHVQGSPRHCRRVAAALEHLKAGTRSVPEADVRRLLLTSTVVPAASYNVWLRLQTGQVLCVDALIESSAVVHETNGRIAHEREDLFHDMQKRHDALTASGFAVLHNPPNRIRTHGGDVLAEIERCHQIYNGRGLPAGVKVLSSEWVRPRSRPG